MRRMRSWTGVAVATAAVVLVSIAAAGTASARPAGDTPPPPPAPVPVAAWRAYRAAIVDAAVVEPGEVSPGLVMLDGSDPRVERRTIDGEDYVLVSTLSSRPLTDVSPGQPFTLGRTSWVTIPGQVRARCLASGCDRMGPKRLVMRLRQILGLPPDAAYGVLTRFWARPTDMFRPCTDPRITSRTCPTKAVSGDLTPPVPVTVGTVNLDRFLWQQTAYALRMPDRFSTDTAVSCASAWPEPEACYGYPWTRLGYTYDWGRGREAGVSEFVVVSGARAQLEWTGSPTEVLTAD